MKRQQSCLVKRLGGDFEVVLVPSGTSPYHHLHSKRPGIVGKAGLLKRPKDGEQMLQLLTHWVVMRRSKLKSNQRPSVLMKDRQIRRSVKVQAIERNRVSSVKKCPASWLAVEQGAECMDMLKLVELPQGQRNFLFEKEVR